MLYVVVRCTPQTTNLFRVDIINTSAGPRTCPWSVALQRLVSRSAGRVLVGTRIARASAARFAAPEAAAAAAPPPRRELGRLVLEEVSVLLTVPHHAEALLHEAHLRLLGTRGWTP